MTMQIATKVSWVSTTSRIIVYHKQKISSNFRIFFGLNLAFNDFYRNFKISRKIAALLKNYWKSVRLSKLGTITAKNSDLSAVAESHDFPTWYVCLVYVLFDALWYDEWHNIFALKTYEKFSWFCNSFFSKATLW